MLNINVDFDKYVGKIKPMHAVNNGPVCSGAGRTEFSVGMMNGKPAFKEVSVE